ncbi:MAG TPA: hypothetical protein VGH28_06480 [Polyangiaceae bacterium]
MATGVAAAAFYVPGVRACHGDFPVPLDDVFIHFDFARSLCRGHPFAWIAGQGYSSGETSPLYAVVLAIGWAVGFRGGALAIFAALIACASIVWAMLSLRELFQGRALVAGAVATFLVAIGALDFALFSGMEVALFVALLFRAFVLADRVVRAPPHLRSGRQWKLGAIGAALVWTRPEAAVVVAVLAVLAARHARSQSPLAALVRVASPGALATLAIAALNWAMTGDYASAGARLKLLSSNPYLSDLDRARELVLNLLHFEWRVLESSVVARPAWLLALALCALASLASRRTRAIGGAVLASALLFTLLVSFNGAARYQGFRYYAPALAMLVLAVGLGVSAIARRAGSPLAFAVAIFFAVGAAWRIQPQIGFFRGASENIHDQQARVGKMLRTLGPPGARVLLGDAGAIPYFSDRGAIDALGLGGFREMPFTRAALSGEASTLELIQRLSPAERPALVALYPNWFPIITSRFAREITHVTIEHNVICGGSTKFVGAADWSALDGDSAPDGAIDELDVADVESERAHRYASPAPNGGWAVANVLARVFDGGRIVPAGERESFTARAASDRAIFVLRSDEAIDARVEIGSASVDLVAPRARDAWTEARSSAIAVHAGARVAILARTPLRDFHVWITR